MESIHFLLASHSNILHRELNSWFQLILFPDYLKHDETTP